MATVLIVDDIPAIHDLLNGLLGPHGHESTGSVTGEEALELYKKKPYDVVLVDYSMDGMNGMEFLDRLLKMDPNAVAIMMTGYSSDDTRNEALEAGAFDMVEKPFDLKSFLQTVEAGVVARETRLQ